MRVRQDARRPNPARTTSPGLPFLTLSPGRQAVALSLAATSPKLAGGRSAEGADCVVSANPNQCRLEVHARSRPCQQVAIHLLGCATAPDAAGNFTLVYKDGSTDQRPLTMSLWTAPPSHASTDLSVRSTLAYVTP